MHFSGETFYRAFEQAEGNLIQRVKKKTAKHTTQHVRACCVLIWRLACSWLLVPRLAVLDGGALCSLGKVELQPTSLLFLHPRLGSLLSTLDPEDKILF